MRVGPIASWELLILLIAFALPVWATILAIRHPGHSTTNRLLFLLLIWLVPFFGPLAALFLLRSTGADQ